MRATVNQQTCNGRGLCEELCPEVFSLQTDNKAMVIVDEVPAALADTCENAADSCPEEAITTEA